jgi:DNA-binding NarL/FixJ family response regulator
MEQTAMTSTAVTTVAVLADDLIWASRLRAAIANAGFEAVAARRADDIAGGFAVIDLGGRAYDGVEAVRSAARAGAVVLGVGQHEDVELRKAALAAGAKRVLSYNKLFSDGPNVMTRLVEGTL